MISTNDPALPEIVESSSRISDDILTYEERAKKYRTKLEAHQKSKGLRLKTFLLGKRRYFRSLDIIPRRKRAEDVDMMCRYFNGDQYGSYDNMGIYNDKRNDGDFAYAIPVLSGHVEQAFLQLLKVKPQYTITTDDKDDPTMKLVAQMCEDIGVKELQRVTDATVHSELYNMLLGGESYRFLGWEPNKVSPKIAKRPKYLKEKVVLPARRECAECKTDVAMDATKCPKCGGTDITDYPEGETVRHNFSGYNEIQLGENTLHIPHMLSCQRDMSAIEPEDSTFLIEYSYLDKHVMEWQYQTEIEPSREGLPVEMLLRFDLERGSNQTDAIIGTSRLAAPGREGTFGSGVSPTSTSTLTGRKQPQERHYWEPAEYGQFYCDQEEVLPNGKKIPADTLLGDFYPNGVYVLFGGDTVLDMDPCIRPRKVTLVRYGRIAGTNSGAGMKKIMPLQDAENDNFNLNQTVKHTVGHPLTVIDGHYVSELPGAGNVLKVTRAGLDDVGKVVKQFQGQAVNNSDGTQQVIDGAMQFIAGTNTVGGTGVVGAPDMKAAGTATGIAAMQEQAAGRQSGPVDQRIHADRELIIQLLENIQEYSTEEQKTELAKRHGADVVATFLNCKLRQTMTVGIKSNSDMPRSMALTQANYLAFGQAASTILPEAANNPWIMEFLADLATSMGFPFSIGEGRNDRREAEYRLNVLTVIETEMIAKRPELVQNPVDFAIALHTELAKRCAPLIMVNEDEADPAAPNDDDIPRVFMQEHKSFMDVYKDALFSERAKAWSQSYKLVVIQLWIDHYKGDTSKGAVAAQLQAAAEKAMQPPEPPPPPPPPSPEEVAALEQQAREDEQQHELEMRGAEHEADEEAADSQLKRDLEMEKQESEDAIKLEKVRLAGQAKIAAARPKPQPAKASSAKK